MRWSELQADAGLVTALDHAGARPEAGSQNDKRHWSERFADACAVAVAEELRLHPELKGKSISPSKIGDGNEKMTPLGGGESKRIDVAVVDRVLGLELGLSLKGLNFRDAQSGNFDKNLTGRLYELADEVRLVHEFLPRAFMVGLLFIPLAAVDDKTSGNSSFARAVIKLRERTGRLDPLLPSQLSRCDRGYVALYSSSVDHPVFEPGLLRLINVQTSTPPRRGRPRIAGTLSLREAVREIVEAATDSASAEWAEPEDD